MVDMLAKVSVSREDILCSQGGINGVIDGDVVDKCGNVGDGDDVKGDGNADNLGDDGVWLTQRSQNRGIKREMKFKSRGNAAAVDIGQQFVRAASEREFRVVVREFPVVVELLRSGVNFAAKWAHLNGLLSTRTARVGELLGLHGLVRAFFRDRHLMLSIAHNPSAKDALPKVASGPQLPLQAPKGEESKAVSFNMASKIIDQKLSIDNFKNKNYSHQNNSENNNNVESVIKESPSTKDLPKQHRLICRASTSQEFRRVCEALPEIHDHLRSNAVRKWQMLNLMDKGGIVKKLFGFPGFTRVYFEGKHMSFSMREAKAIEGQKAMIKSYSQVVNDSVAMTGLKGDYKRVNSGSMKPNIDNFRIEASDKGRKVSHQVMSGNRAEKSAPAVNIKSHVGKNINAGHFLLSNCVQIKDGTVGMILAPLGVQRFVSAACDMFVNALRIADVDKRSIELQRCLSQAINKGKIPNFLLMANIRFVRDKLMMDDILDSKFEHTSASSPDTVLSIDRTAQIFRDFPELYDQILNSSTNEEINNLILDLIENRDFCKDIFCLDRVLMLRSVPSPSTRASKLKGKPLVGDLMFDLSAINIIKSFGCNTDLTKILEGEGCAWSFVDAIFFLNSLVLRQTIDATCPASDEITRGLNFVTNCLVLHSHKDPWGGEKELDDDLLNELSSAIEVFEEESFFRRKCHATILELKRLKIGNDIKACKGIISARLLQKVNEFYLCVEKKRSVESQLGVLTKVDKICKGCKLSGDPIVTQGAISTMTRKFIQRKVRSLQLGSPVFRLPSSSELICPASEEIVCLQLFNMFDCILNQKEKSTMQIISPSLDSVIPNVSDECSIILASDPVMAINEENELKLKDDSKSAELPDSVSVNVVYAETQNKTVVPEAAVGVTCPLCEEKFIGVLSSSNIEEVNIFACESCIKVLEAKADIKLIKSVSVTEFFSPPPSSRTRQAKNPK